MNFSELLILAINNFINILPMRIFSKISLKVRIYIHRQSAKSLRNGMLFISFTNLKPAVLASISLSNVSTASTFAKGDFSDVLPPLVEGNRLTWSLFWLCRDVKNDNTAPFSFSYSFSLSFFVFLTFIAAAKIFVIHGNF